MEFVVHEEAIDLHLGLLEAIGPPEEGPWPTLRSLGRSETRTFRAVVLENEYLRVTLIPDLGGRIAAIHDLRTGTEILPRPASLEAVAGGPRGVDLPFGIEVSLDGGPRLNALGPVRTAMDEESGEAAVWLSETISGWGHSWHLRVSLPNERAAIRLELRVLNREGTSYYNGGFRASGMERAGKLWSSALGGFSVVELDAPMEDGLLRFGRGIELSWRQSDAFSIELIPFSGIGTPNGFGPGGAYSVREGSLLVQASETVSGAKAALLTEAGQTLEAPLDLDPGRIESIDLGGVVPQALAILGPERQVLMEGPPSGGEETRKSPFSLRTESDRGLRAVEVSPLLRTAVINERARRAMIAKEYENAAELFERSLLYNGDDPIAWWGLAAARRLAGEEGERPELLNARWLAPLEPLVRAEIYLGMPADSGANPTGLLDPLDETPDVFIEVAATLVDHGMWQDAMRWIDEALRRHDLGALHWLAAYTYHRGTGFRMEAARHVGLARERSGPPYAWRPIEKEAIEELNGAFPSQK
ncbi:DUF5107 domain-containing protein [bacterium]|nr:MAG: DUF5107 domain-containing protein [bacterium]